MIEIKNLYKSFGDKVVFRDFSCSIQEHAITCIMGPSGYGKTTLLMLLLGLQKPDGGNITGLANKQKSAVFQEDRLCDNISAVSNIRLAGRHVTKKAAETMLGFVGLGDSAYQPVRAFSGGMRQRVSILRALAAEYDIILLDEPFHSLDEDTKAKTIDYFKTSVQGKTVIYITHDKADYALLGGNILMVDTVPG